jgi:hypothetical protein
MKNLISIISFSTFATGILVNLLCVFFTFHYRFFAGLIFEYYLNFIDNFVPKQGIKTDYIITNIENLNIFEEALGISFFGFTLLFSCIFFFFFFLRNLVYTNIYYVFYLYIFFFFLGYIFFRFDHFLFFYEETPSQCLVADMELTLNLVIDLSKYFVIILFFFSPLFIIPFFYFFRFIVFFVYFYTEKDIFVFYNNEPPIKEEMDLIKKSSFDYLFYEKTSGILEMIIKLESEQFLLTNTIYNKLLFNLILFNYISCIFVEFYKKIILRKKWDSNPR